MALTKKERDALPPEHFAVPESRQLPIHDEKHVKMAWDMVDNTKGLSDQQRKNARAHILRRAKELGMDTSGWRKIKAMSVLPRMFQAMSLEVPETPDHPNKIPFSGVLVRLDQSSDAPPHGSFGKRIFLPRAVAETALPTLLGMAINYVPNLKGHDPKAKIGIIDEATIETDTLGPYVKIEGFFYAADFPNAVTRIRADKSVLGFSFEAERILVRDVEADPMVIEELTFTGAAVLRKDSAAYQTTAIAAEADTDEDEEEDKIIMEQLEQILSKLSDIGTRLEKLESGQTKITAAHAVAEKVKPHADKLHEIANAMEKDGIGCGAAPAGHVHVLRHMADSMMSEAHGGAVPDRYRGPSMYSAAAPVAAAADPQTKQEIESLKGAVANVTTLLKDLKAKADAGAFNTPERKTIAPRFTAILAKAGVTLEAGKVLNTSELDTALAKLNLEPQKRMEIKAALRNAGVYDPMQAAA